MYFMYVFFDSILKHEIKSNAVTLHTCVQFVVYISILLSIWCDRCSSVCIATRYELDGPVFDPQRGARLSVTVQIGPGAHLVSCKMGTGPFPGVNQPERGVEYQPYLAPC